MIVGAITRESKDIEALLKFYQQAFAVPDSNIVRVGEDHCGFSTENTYLGFDKVDEVSASGNTIIWFHTHMVQELYDKFIELGAESLYEPTEEMTPGEILAEVLDPDGNRIGIIGPVPKEADDDFL